MTCYLTAAKEQGIGAILAFAMAYLRGRYNGGAFTKTVIDEPCAPLSPKSFVSLLDSPDAAAISS
ncbi:phage holin family protein [Staphylococcus aureus]